jgi:flagellar motor switch protein FliM
MTDALSADAIAQLFAAAEEGNLPDAARPPERRARSIRKINFGRPMMLSLAEQRRFERAHTTYCVDAAARLSNELLTTVELEVINSSQLAWGGAVGDVPQRSVLGVARCTPGDAKVLMCVEEALVLRMIERLLGGSFTETQPSRRLTEIDLMLARGVFEGLLAPLSTVWRGLLGLKLSLVDFESREKSLELLPSSESTLELTIEARDESASSTISLLVPHAAMKSATKSLGIATHDSDDGDSAEDATAMRSALGSVHLEVRAEAGQTGLTLAEVLSLSKGDVVRLGAAGSACIVAGDSRLHRVRPGLSGKRRAVQIIDPIGGNR